MKYCIFVKLSYQLEVFFYQMICVVNKEILFKIETERKKGRSTGILTLAFPTKFGQKIFH